MSFMDRFRKLFKEDQVKRVVEPFDEARSGEAPVLVLPEVHYFRLRLVEMFITKKTWLGKTWYPAVHGLVKATYAGADLELPSVADTSKLFEEQAGTGDVVARNFQLTPLLPYRGGAVEILCGLFGMQGEDYLGKVIKVLSDFSSLLAVPQLSQALTVAGPLTAGVQDLFGAADGRMHLGHHDQWVSVIDPDHPADNAFRSGYVAILRAEEGEVDRGALRVEDQQLRVVRNGDSSPYTERDHMLIHVEARTERPDLARLSTFWKPFKESIEALGDGEDEKAKALIRQAIATARTSDDLTDADRSRVTQRLKDLYLEAKDDLDFAGLVRDDSSLAERVTLRSSATAAREAGVPTLEELWQDL
jgi:hypothetical protein